MRDTRSIRDTLPKALRHLLFAATAGLFAVASQGATQQRPVESAVAFAASKGHVSKDVQLKGELFRPQGNGPFPAVVLMHGCGGWQPAARFALRQHAQRLSQGGYVVLNLDSFGPRGLSGNRMCPNNTLLQRALDYRTSDAFDALRYLQSLDFVDPQNVFLMGQSNGGSVAIKAAQASEHRRRAGDIPGFRGAVAYYPWCGGFGRVSLGAPLLVFAGGRDDWVSADECRRMSARGAELDVIVYPDAAHSFDLQVMQHRFHGYLIGHHPAAANDSSARMLSFFDGNLTEELRTARARSAGEAPVAMLGR